MLNNISIQGVDCYLMLVSDVFFGCCMVCNSVQQKLWSSLDTACFHLATNIGKSFNIYVYARIFFFFHIIDNLHEIKYSLAYPEPCFKKNIVTSLIWNDYTLFLSSLVSSRYVFDGDRRYFTVSVVSALRHVPKPGYGLAPRSHTFSSATVSILLNGF